MQILQKITPAVIQAATAMLSPFVPEISPTGLIAALRQYDNAGQKKENLPERPYTREEVAKMLSLSVQTINRMMNAGKLRKIQVGLRAVRIDPQSVRELLNSQPGKEA